VETIASTKAGDFMNSITIYPAEGLQGEIRVPGDKSISHRAVMLGAIAQGRTCIEGFLPADDCRRTVDAFRLLGVNIRETASDKLIIEGRGLHGLNQPLKDINLGNSGTSMRLLAGILAGQGFNSVLDGDDSLRRRPMDRIIIPLKKMGAEVRGEQADKYPPLHFSPPEALKGITYSLPVASAQVKSALLLAGLYARGETRVIEPVRSRDHTERMLRQFGVSIEIDGLTVGVSGLEGVELEGRKITVPGDFSSAAFFIIAALIVPRSEVLIKGVGINPTRTGLLEILQDMGGQVKLLNEDYHVSEPVADIYVRSSSLRGVSIQPEIVPRMIDEFPILCVAAALAQGTTSIRGAKELRVKETDRIRSMTQGLRGMGVEIEEFGDGMEIEGRPGLLGTKCHSFGDHRTAMSLAIAGLAAKGETEITGTDCIATSFPGFFELLDSLRDKG
jgi:3-phosphoshikimate 1-carboxyvinyltransferase